MAYFECKFDGDIVVELSTEPLKLNPSNELYESILNLIIQKVNHAISVYKMHPGRLIESPTNEWSKSLTEDLKIPIRVKVIHGCQLPGPYMKYQLVFGIEMTQDIVDTYEKMNGNLLVNLLDELF